MDSIYAKGERFTSGDQLDFGHLHESYENGMTPPWLVEAKMEADKAAAAAVQAMRDANETFPASDMSTIRDITTLLIPTMREEKLAEGKKAA